MADYTKIRMSIKDVFVKKKKELLGKAEVFLLAIVIDDLQEEPIVTQSGVFQKIKKNTSLPLGPSGLAIYRNPNEEMPNQLDFRILVMESDERVRNSGQSMEEITSSSAFNAVFFTVLNALLLVISSID